MYSKPVVSPGESAKAPVVITPNFGGQAKNFQRHIRWLNEMGHPVLALSLKYNDWKEFQPLPISNDFELGVRHLWAEQIEAALNTLPEEKIIYSFSYPSCAALEAIARRHAYDIKGWITEGGPFLEGLRCTWNLFTIAYPIRSRLLRAGATLATSLYLGNKSYARDLDNYLNELPSDLPILSVRGWKDPLVPPSAIDEVFEGHERLDYQTLALPEGGHLDGLSQQGAEYKKRVKSFLTRLEHSCSSHFSMNK